jgi:biopolymer transport protein ExbB
MFAKLSLMDLLLKGGWTMVVLLLLSLISWYIIFERSIRFRQATIDVEHFLLKIKKFIQTGKLVEASDLCQETPGPVAATLKAGLRQVSKGYTPAKEAMERASAKELLDLEHSLAMLATIGSISPFVGLFGTVLGIITAFSSLADAGGAGVAGVSNGIAEALVATAAGLFTAIPATMSYNFFIRRINRFDTEMTTTASEFLDAIPWRIETASHASRSTVAAGSAEKVQP